MLIDEAAQAVEASTLIPLKYGCRRLILIGDPEQLPATVFSQAANGTTSYPHYHQPYPHYHQPYPHYNHTLPPFTITITSYPRASSHPHRHSHQHLCTLIIPSTPRI